MRLHRRGPNPLTPVLPVAVLFSLAFSSCHPMGTGMEGTDTSEDAAGRTPTDLVSEWVGMWNSYDLDRVGDLFLMDGRLSYFSSEFEGVIQGFEAVMEHHRGFGFVPGGEDLGNRLWVEGLTEDVLGETAVLTGIWFFQRADATAPPQRGPVTFVAALSEGGWRFAHMNFGTYLESEGEEGEEGEEGA